MLGLLSFVFVLLAALCSTAAASRQPSRTEWQKMIIARHKKHQPSPAQLGDEFAKKQKAIVKAKAAKDAYMHSAAHHMQLVREGNRMAEMERHHPLNSGYNLAIQGKAGKDKKCGDRLSFDELGVPNTELVRRIFRPSAFVQQPGPKAGSAQNLKDEGRSMVGSIDSMEKDEPVEPYFKVFKDGFSYTKCTKDAMYEFDDKYGDNKDQYKNTYNTSIVKYKEIVLKENQVAMTPRKCYEFCRSVPDMGYFGIRMGSDCYCTPFFKDMASGSDNCDMPCPGDPTMMCGGQEKSGIFEMHLCADTAGDLMYMSVWAEVALVYFYDTAFMTDKLAHHLQDIGEILQGIAGQAGDPVASDLAQEAKKEAGSLFDPTTGWGVCKADYIRLLDIYNSAEPLYEADFTFATELQKAEDTIAMEDYLRKKLEKCAKAAEDPILAVYPFYFQFMASLDEFDLQARNDKFADGLVGFYPITYYMDSTSRPEMSTCKGEMLGRPMVLTLSGCAEACDQITQPLRCAAFQYFQIMDGEKQRPVCFLYSEVMEVRTYKCDKFLSDMLSDIQVSSRSKLRGNVSAPTNKLDLCTKVRTAKAYSGLSCQSIWGKESSMIKECPDECAETSGPAYSALCMARLSLAKPRVKVKEYARCFGNDNTEVEQKDSDFRLQEFGTDASGGAGPLIEGEIVMGGEVVEEPYGHVWTPGPAGQR